ncbi:MAG: elongation factor EF-2, partial [Candidatus Aenigmarchaeota archaeon]|nr:elongation factor EF-2 [Candidatus Aenigmarchaeota archaeon]
VVLNMVVEHHPNPVDAQAYRIPKIWHGDIDSAVGKGLLKCDPKTHITFVCTKIVVDKHAGEVAAGRLFSGTLTSGQEVYQVMGKRKTRIQQLSVYNGPKREAVQSVPSGNIVGIVGLKDIFSGETISDVEDIEPFEEIKHIFEPVITKAIEAKRAADLPKLVEVLKQVNKEDPTLSVEINEETGEHLISGMGELHLEVIENRITNNKGIEVKTSPPIVVYRETVTSDSPEQEGKSPNKHNKFYIKVKPMPDGLFEAIRKGEISERRVKKKDLALIQQLRDCGMGADEAKKVKDIYKGNLFIDMTRGIVHIGEIMEMVLDSFEEVMRGGPIAREPGTKVMVYLMDVKLHEDAIHRGPAQIIPAVRGGLKAAILTAKPTLLEPLQLMEFDAPVDHMGSLSKLVQNRRGQLLNMEQQGELVKIKAKMPVGEMFGLSSDLRSATNGRGTQFLVDQSFERLPHQLQEEVIKKLRQRKGLGENE